MTVSIITATFNSERTIERAVRSVLAQKLINLEYIIVDGASSDSTNQIISAIADSRCRVVSEPDSGIYDALNKGLRLCTGELVGFLHSDDLFPHDFVLAEVASLLERHSGALGVYGDLDYFQKDPPHRIVRRWSGGTTNLLQLYLGWMPPHPTLFLRREVYQRYGLFDTRIGSAADYEFTLRVFLREHSRILYRRKVLTLMQVGGASDSGWRSRVRSLATDLLSWHRNSNLFNPLLGLTKPIRKLPQFFARRSSAENGGLKGR